jgi:hypothetical protein
MCLHDSVIRVIENCDLQNLVNFATELKESGHNQSKTAAVAIQNKVSTDQTAAMTSQCHCAWNKPNFFFFIFFFGF